MIFDYVGYFFNLNKWIYCEPYINIKEYFVFY